MKNTVLELQKLSAGYNGKNVIRDISFDVGAGEIFALVGESGSGKSTVLKTIMGLPSNGVRTSGGAIKFNGRNLTELSAEERRKLLGDKLCTVFQNPATSMNPIRKIRSQFLDTMRSHKRFDTEKSLAAIRTAFIKIGLGDADRVLDCCPFELSGGMCQRVALAMAMVMEPTLILADEPTSALDVMNQRQVIEEFRILREECGASILLVTHNISLASHIADRVAIMHCGEIVECGVTGEVLKSPQHSYTKKLISDVPCLRAAYPAYNYSSKFLEVSSVTKRYCIAERTIDAVRNVGFSLSRGEVLGIVGESGSGKSTLSRQLLQLENTDEGSIKYEGEEVTAMNRRSLRNLYRRAQMVFQIPLTSFDQNKRIRVTMRDAARNLTDRKRKSAADEYINDLMHRVGLTPELADRYPWEISGGQCQRAAIARALIAEPELLICDEATSALDVSSQARIADLLRSLVRECNMSMIFISHDIALVSGLCHTVMVMKDGQCVEYGPVEKIITAPENGYTMELLKASSFC
ncbi:ABC transporter ATP-binding protein [Maridesulfovibrio sp.]|uniref:ABC transporter ATP-binding protein n=1 Tax=Maridesulfovibrio sp. TaxID=2795000 RepID=UPI0029CA20F5|nr:ABC transporter ATP-binding protein [Maridesulfovibrio sp.]